MPSRSYKIILLSLALILLFTMVRTSDAVAQDDGEWDALAPAYVVEYDDQGRQYIREAEDGIHVLSNVEEPDLYGYTWDDTVPMEWIDAKSLGEKLILNDDHQVNDVDLGFSFPFYENVFSSINVGEPGLLSFGELGDMMNFLYGFPWHEEPNNIISPFFRKGLGYQLDGKSNIYLYRAGTNPNRYTVIEWHELTSGLGDEYPGSYTFQAILYENGDIKFQYKRLEEEEKFCFAVGIEDSRGIIGLGRSCETVSMLNNKAIFITRPAPAKRVVISPFRDDVMAIPGKQALYKIEIINNGDLGTETYQIASNSAWPIQLFKEDGITLLPETMTLDQAGSQFVWAKVDIPASATVADENEATVTATSTTNPEASFTTKLVQYIPAAFSTSYNKNDESVARLIWPSARKEILIENETGTDASPSMKELPGIGYITFSLKEYSETTRAICYQIINRVGLPLTNKRTLVYSNDGSLFFFGDISVSVTENNTIHVAWVETRFLSGGFNRNMWSAVLSGDGDILQSPWQVTQNEEEFNAPDYFYISDLHVKSISANKVITSWSEHTFVDGVEEFGEVFYRIVDQEGNALVETTNLTSDLPQTAGYVRVQPALLGDGRIFILYEKITRWESGGVSFEPYYRIINDQGVILETKPLDRWLFSGSDILVLQSNRIVVAGRRLTIFDASTFNVTKMVPDGALDHPTAGRWNGYNASLLEMSEGNIMVLWSPGDYKTLLYAVVSPDGDVLNGPYVIDEGQISLAFTSAYSTVNNTWEPQPGVDMVVHNYFNHLPVAPGGSAGLRIQYSNLGLDTGSNSKLRLTLPAGLTYLSNDSGVEPQISGDQVIWQFGDTAFGEYKEFNILLASAPDLPIDTVLKVATHISTDQPDTNPDDNGQDVDVWVSIPIYIPLIAN